MTRFIYIQFLLWKYFILYILSVSKFIQVPKQKLVKNFFEDAGGAFIKFGQLLALRVDVLPKEYFLELVDLYDNVKSFSYQEAERIIEYELGSKPEKIFSYFEKEPFASASFGQVYAAKIRSEKIIVKIQRPDIQGLVNVDFVFIDLLATLGDIFFKIEALPWKDFASEFKEWTLKELDYRIEADNSLKIYENNINTDNSLVYIPKTYDKYTTKKILVQEYLDGIPLSRIMRGLKDGRLSFEKLKKMGIDIQKAPKILVTELMKEYFIDGLFHADPHPGNILLFTDGKIGLIDFGIIGEAPPKRKEFLQFIEAGAKTQTDETQYEKMGYYFLEFSGDRVKQITTSVLPANSDENYLNKFFHILAKNFADSIKLTQMNTRSGLASKKIDYTVMFMQAIKYAQRYQIRLPKQIIVFIRALSIIGYLAKEMDNRFLLTDVILNFCKRYSPDSIPKFSANSQYRRMNREEALDKFNNWLSLLVEIDPKLYQLVGEYISKYNEKSLNV